MIAQGAGGDATHGPHPPPALMVSAGRRVAVGAHRDAARRGRAGNARRRPKRSPPTSASSSAVRKDIAAERDSLQKGNRRDRRRSHAHGGAGRRAAEAAGRARGLARRRARARGRSGAPGRQPERPDRQARSRASTRRRAPPARPPAPTPSPEPACCATPAGWRPRSLSRHCADISRFRLTALRFGTIGAPDGSGGSERGPFNRHPRRCTGDGAGRRLGCLRRSVSVLRPTLDPQCRRRVSCVARWDGTDISRSRTVRAGRRTRCGDGKRLPYRCHPRDRFQPTGSLYRVSKRRDSHRSRPMVGGW